MFGTEVNFVEVHAIVTDEKEAFVKDLTAEDFEILEDGRPQKTAVFSLVDLPVERPVMAVGPDRAGGAGRARGDPLVRWSNLCARAGRAAHRFFPVSAGEGCCEEIHSAVSGRERSGGGGLHERSCRGGAGTDEPSEPAPCLDRPLHGEKLPSASAEKLAIHIRDTATGEALADDGQPVRSVAGLQAAREIKDPYAAQRAQYARRTLEAVGNVARWMSDVQGRRKALLLFSEGIDYDIYEPFRQRGDRARSGRPGRGGPAQRANVNVYAVDPRGLNQFGDLMAVHAGSDYPQLDYGTFRGTSASCCWPGKPDHAGRADRRPRHRQSE